MRDYEFEKNISAIHNVSFLIFIIGMLILLTCDILIIDAISLVFSTLGLFVIGITEYILSYEWYLDK